MTRAEFTARYPHASEQVIRLNCEDAITRTGPTPPARVERPAKAKETTAKQPRKQPVETSDAFYNRHAHAQTPNPVLERSLGDGAMDPNETQRGNPVRFLVRVTSFRRRLLDEDNLCEKYVVDCCRYSGLLSGDAPETTRIEVSQQKVTREEDERTELTIVERDVGQSALPL
jgi:hypothetical protein